MGTGNFGAADGPGASTRPALSSYGQTNEFG